MLPLSSWTNAIDIKMWTSPSPVWNEMVPKNFENARICMNPDGIANNDDNNNY